jgi:Ras-related protein Rab-7A
MVMIHSVLIYNSVGKTSLIYQCLGKDIPSQHKPTIGTDFFTKELIVDGRLIMMQIWDTGGLDQYQSKSYCYYRETNCCILVYSITDPRSFENLDKWQDNFLLYMTPKESANFTFLVIGNKVDLENERKVSLESVQKWCDMRDNTFHFETSAKGKINVDQIFKNTARCAFAHKYS